jgi:CRISPR-associated protein Cmr6
MFKGILRVKIKKNGSYDPQKTGIWIDGKKKHSISKEFNLFNDLNYKECSFELNNNNLIKIIVDGQEINREEKTRPKKKKQCSNKIYLVPNDTCLNITEKEQIDNLNLRINKFVKNSFDDEKNKYQFEINEINLSFDNHSSKIDSYFKSLTSYMEENKKYDFSLKISNRLIVGLGSVSVYETSITLHHIYGIPYIPSSAIKGVLRSYIILECFSEELENYSEDKYQKFEEEVLFAKDEDGNYKHKWFIDIFGSQEQEGEIIFFDSFSQDVKIQNDIMTPHYGDYYKDKKNKVAPTDTQSPNPIPFLTVVGEFRFIIATKKNSIEKYKIRDKSIKEWLKEALTNHGIGAKTAVGYGYFEATS